MIMMSGHELKEHNLNDHRFTLKHSATGWKLFPWGSQRAADEGYRVCAFELLAPVFTSESSDLEILQLSTVSITTLFSSSFSPLNFKG